MNETINVDGIVLRVGNKPTDPSPSGSSFTLPNGKRFGFGWAPDHMYRMDSWIVGVTRTFYPGRDYHSAHDIETGGSTWSADIAAGTSFGMDPDQNGFQAGNASVRFPVPVWHVLQIEDGFCVVLHFDATVKTGGNVLLVGYSGELRWRIHRSGGQRTATYSYVRQLNQNDIEAGADRYLAIVDAHTGLILTTRP